MVADTFVGGGIPMDGSLFGLSCRVFQYVSSYIECAIYDLFVIVHISYFQFIHRSKDSAMLSLLHCCYTEQLDNTLILIFEIDLCCCVEPECLVIMRGLFVETSFRETRIKTRHSTEVN